MSDLLGIGSSGIAAYQRALATVSNNIANVTNDGYTRQDVAVASNQPRLVGGSYIGTGVRFDAVRRQYDAFVESNLRNSNSDLQSQEPLLSYVNRLIDIMGDESIGLTTAMNLFFESARDLATDPASIVQRSIFLRDADGLAARFRQLSGQFELLDNETRQSVETDIGQINSLTRQLALLNKQLAKHATTDRQPPELLDQRDQLLRDLSGLTAFKTRFEPNGAVLVSVGDIVSQGMLVEGAVSRDIGLSNQAVNEEGRLQFVIDPYGEPQALPNLLSGKVGGTLAFREQVLGPALQALDNLAEVMAREVNAVHRSGIDAEGRLGQDLFRIDPAARGSAAGMSTALQDVSRVAAAGQFRIIDDPLNTGNAQASIQYRDAAYAGPTGLYGTLGAAQVPQIASEELTIGLAQPFAHLGVVPLGMQDLVLTLEQPVSGQSLQVLTRDGRHLLGQALSTQEQLLLMRSANGMEAGATYDAQPLTDSSRYLDMDLFIGAKADVRQLLQFDEVTGRLVDPLPAPAILQGRALPGGLTGPLAAGLYTLSGVPLGALNVTGPLSVATVAQWIDSHSALTGVRASVVDGGIRLARPDSNTTDDIRLGLTAAGQPADLARLGFDTSVYLKGAAADDLLVFVTSSAPTSTVANVSAQFVGGQGDTKQALRSQDLELLFIANDRYQIRERGTDTLLAERAFDPLDPNARIQYRGLTVAFSAAPRAGDRYTIDGNRDGIGNNEAMLEIVALEKERLMPDGLTMTEAYIERVNQVGNVARQAAISKQALTVVYTQAREARDSISGVSLDEEAAALVRFQQAYQANAKVMQVAGQLFETILGVR